MVVVVVVVVVVVFFRTLRFCASGKHSEDIQKTFTGGPQACCYCTELQGGMPVIL